MQDSLLDQPGAFSEAEQAELRTHADVGARILAGANLDDLATWVRAHHERPDGSGYPRGLRDDAIPLEAKVLGAADAFESLTSEGLSAEQAARELRERTPDELDAQVVEALLAGVREDSRPAASKRLA